MGAESRGVVRIVQEKIDAGAVLKSVEDPSAGGIALFVGATRNQSHGRSVVALEYEAYEPMAVAVLRSIVDEARRRFGIVHMSIVHRTGRVAIGEASVVIAASAAHRNEAFGACRFAIDTLKTSAPIWKKEFFADGSAWVDPGAGGSAA